VLPKKKKSELQKDEYSMTHFMEVLQRTKTLLNSVLEGIHTNKNLKHICEKYIPTTEQGLPPGREGQKEKIGEIPMDFECQVTYYFWLIIGKC
jgi:hypothetical protein